MVSAEKRMEESAPGPAHVGGSCGSPVRGAERAWGQNLGDGSGMVSRPQLTRDGRVCHCPPQTATSEGLTGYSQLADFSPYLPSALPGELPVGTEQLGRHGVLGKESSPVAGQGALLGHPAGERVATLREHQSTSACLPPPARIRHEERVP